MGLVVIFGGGLMAKDPMTLRCRAFLVPRLQTGIEKDFDEANRSEILRRPDPGTDFLRYAFGIHRHAKQLLDANQSERLRGIIEKYQEPITRWHDERNMLRCKFNEVMWLYAQASEDDWLRYRDELEAWMRLRMTWTQQEHLAQYRFARDVWSILTPAQQTQLIAGEWKQYAKQTTGHTRGDFTARIIQRALGEPNAPKAFDTETAEWSRKREALHAELRKREDIERQLVFAMDLNSESMVMTACRDATSAYSTLYLAEAEAIRHIVQSAMIKVQPDVELPPKRHGTKRRCVFRKGRRNCSRCSKRINLMEIRLLPPVELGGNAIPCLDQPPRIRFLVSPALRAHHGMDKDDSQAARWLGRDDRGKLVRLGQFEPTSEGYRTRRERLIESVLKPEALRAKRYSTRLARPS